VTPRRLVTLRWYRRHRNVIGYALLAIGVAIALIRVYQLAQEGSRAHTALCAQQVDLRRRIAQGELYLRLTPAQRDRQFGLLGSTPVSVVRGQLLGERRTLQAYEGLKC
jgi:hypothetical protein